MSNRTALNAILSLTLILGFARSSYAHPTYALTDLGNLGAVPNFPYPSAINRSGQVVGFSEISTGQFHAFLYSNGQMKDLGGAGGINSAATAINDKGLIVGYEEGTDLIPHAFLYAFGSVVNIGQNSGELGGNTSVPHGINSKGQVVGDAGTQSPAGQSLNAFLYSNGSMTNLGALGGAQSYGLGINDRGEVTGSADTQIAPHPDENNGFDVVQPHAFIYSHGKMTDIGTLGGNTSFGLSINNKGQVTGYSYADSRDDPFAFLYSDGEMINLGTFGGPISTGWAINNSGEVVGDAFDALGNDFAFIYSGGKMRKLITLIAVDSPLAPYVTLEVATGINDKGKITAVGFDSRTGVQHAYLLIPECHRHDGDARAVKEDQTNDRDRCER